MIEGRWWKQCQLGTSCTTADETSQKFWPAPLSLLLLKQKNYTLTEGIPLSARLSNFILFFSFWHHSTPLIRTKIYIPPTFVFLVCGFLMSPFCSACVKIGATFTYHSSGHLFVQVPWGEGLHGESSWGMQTTRLRSGRTAKLTMEGICSLFNFSLAPLFWLVSKTEQAKLTVLLPLLAVSPV